MNKSPITVPDFSLFSYNLEEDFSGKRQYSRKNCHKAIL